MNYISTILIVIVVMALMKYFLNAAKRNPIINDEGFMVLKMNKVYGVIGYVSIGFGLLVVILVGLWNVETIEDLFYALAIVLFFLVLGVPLVLVARNLRIEANEEEIRFFSVTGKITEIKWIEVQEIQYSMIMNELKLKSRTKIARVGIHMIGIPTFLELVKNKVHPSIYGNAVKKFEKALDGE